MRALAKIHVTAFAYVQEEAGGKKSFLKRNDLIKERKLPKLSVLKVGCSVVLQYR